MGLERKPFYKNIYNLLINKVKTDPIILVEDDTVILKYEGHKKITFQICFWLNESRISCFLDAIEIADVYIERIEQSEEFKLFIEALLSNVVEITYFKKGENIYRKHLYYYGIKNGKEKKFMDRFIYKFRFPWIQLKETRESFKPWICATSNNAL